MKEGTKILDRVMASSSASVKLEGFAVCGLKAKVRLTVATAGASSADVMRSANSLFGGALRCIPKSFKVESSNAHAGLATIVGFAHLNKEIVSAADAKGRMKAVAGNLFLDASDNIWAQHGDMFYKNSNVETSEALQDLLQTTASACSPTRSRVMASVETSNKTQGGDLVSFASNGEMHLGYVMATDEANHKLLVLASDCDEPETIDEFDVAEVIPVEDEDLELPEDFAVASSAVVDKSALTSYYKTLYTYNPEFYAELESRINQHSYL